MVYFAKWKIVAIMLVCIVGLLFAAPNFVDEEFAETLPDWVPHKQVSLGLDLQGGSHLLLEVDVNSAIREQLESTVDEARVELRRAKIRYSGLGVNGTTGIKVTIREPAKAEEARQLMRRLDPEGTASLEDNTVIVELSETAVRDRRTAVMSQSLEIIRLRVDEEGTKEPTIQRQGDNRILLQVPGVEDPEELKSIIGKTAKMSFHLTDYQNANMEPTRAAPAGSRWLPLKISEGSGDNPRMVLVKKRVMVSGEDLVDARAGFDQQSGQPVVTFRFNTRGAKKFGDVTAKNVNRPFAIVLDDEVLSDPVIREAILGGSGQISGSFTVKETNDLSLLLRAGALPAPISFLEERSVGPGMGADAVAAGKFASIIGMILVVAFMVVSYGRFGVMADVALVMNVFLILAALSLLQATLTLPGIAGIVLTIGMAVDANVLIFERIREEVRVGRTPISAIDAGYSRALTTIIDANVTTLIAAILLYVFGSGPIRGFAVTLAIGIVTSLFTAVMLTRLIVVSWLRRSQPKELPI
jgi:preprotein translocase subunit SecD